VTVGGRKHEEKVETKEKKMNTENKLSLLVKTSEICTERKQEE
jgi:hypothetical protein